MLQALEQVKYTKELIVHITWYPELPAQEWKMEKSYCVYN